MRVILIIPVLFILAYFIGHGLGYVGMALDEYEVKRYESRIWNNN